MELLRKLLHRFRLIVECALVAMLFGAFYGFVLCIPVYEAVAGVEIRKQHDTDMASSNTEKRVSLETLKTHLNLMKSSSMAHKAASILNENKHNTAGQSFSGENILSRSSFEINTKHGGIVVKVKGENPEECAKLANSYIKAFVAYVSDNKRSNVIAREFLTKPPTIPLSPDRPRIMNTFILIGVIFGVCLVIILDRRASRGSQ